MLDTNYDRPKIAMTLGDPAGVGPEVIVGAWADPRFHAACRAVSVGHPELLRRAARLLKSELEVVEVFAPNDVESSCGVLPCLCAGTDDALEVPPGAVDARGGQAAYDALRCATELALRGQVDGITTGPLSKAALWQAGHHYPGHTELLAEMCGAQDVAMMLYLPPGEGVFGPAGLGVVHVTLHTALRNVFDQLSTPAIFARCRMADEVMRGLKGERPRIGVCALNPHAGELGLFGSEEQTIIEPAVRQGIDAGLDLTGPLPADTLMVRSAAGEFDAVVAMYHDQGHIALKILGMHRAVNITLGLPIIRTSVAHGTAADRAWQGLADPGSMVEAAVMASRLGQPASYSASAIASLMKSMSRK